VARSAARTGFEGVALGAYGVAAGGGGAVSGVQLHGYIRQNSDDRPFGVVNDFVASTLGAMIGLPVPPITLVELSGGEVGSVTLGFGERGVQPPPADLAALADEYPEDAAGTIVFDQWVCNQDRHDENIAYLAKRGVSIFDHDAAIIGHKPPVSASDNLAAGRGAIVTNHPLAPYVEDWRLIEGWIAEVRRLSPRSIRRVAERVYDSRLVTAPERDGIVELLTYRARALGAMMENRLSEFTKIEQQTMTEAGGSNDG
jgi:hypothetical protein